MTYSCMKKICLFCPLFFWDPDPGSMIKHNRIWIWEPGYKKLLDRDPRSGINIPDPQHWFEP
jgi:hypothetical protein